MNISQRLFKNKSVYQSILPYNLNWIIEDLAPVKSFLKQNPLVVADVGARGGSLGELETLRNFIDYYAFDADKEECDRLSQNPPPEFYKFHVFPYFIDATSGFVNFNIYKNPVLSSVYPPSNRFVQIFGYSAFEIDRTLKVESKTLDDILGYNKLTLPDIIKLDTQGSELSILQASKKCLSNAFLVEVEVEFIEIYQGQPLFFDVHKFMYENGFELLYLNRVFNNRNMYDGLSRGQLIFGDALFGRREDRLQELSLEQIIKYIITLINYGHKDFAFHLCQLYPQIRNIIPGIDIYFKFNKYNRLSSLKKNAFFTLDKIIAYLLHKRKTNQLHTDSDRSYPIR